jgi:membrane protein DedA with SNARE-associated domain
MTSIVEWIVNAITAFIDKIGYGGIFGLMTLESACIPIPSEVVMPFSGSLAYFYPDRYNFIIIGLVGALGCLVGSLLAYYAGLYLGRPFVLKYGRYVFLREEHLRKAEWWFERHGDATAFFSRLLPIVRTFISFPAGIGKMNVKKFALYSFVGSLPWTFALAYVGYWLGNKWDVIFQYGHYLDLIMVAAIVILVLWYVLKQDRKSVV